MAAVRDPEGVSAHGNVRYRDAIDYLLTREGEDVPYVDTYPEDVISDLQERGWAELRDDTREPYRRVYITPDGIAEMEDYYDR